MPEVEPEEDSSVQDLSVTEATEPQALSETPLIRGQQESVMADDEDADSGPQAGDLAEDGTEDLKPEGAGPRQKRAENPDESEEDDAPEEDGRRRRPWAQHRVEATVEAMLFASPDVLGFRQIRAILPDEVVTNEAIRAALQAIQERYKAKNSGIMLAEISGGYQIQSQEEHFEFVQSLAKTRTEEKITQAALETLSIIAYKQPITRAEVDAIRGVGSGQLVRTLMDKKMVKVVGRVDLPGRPFQYGTTKQFLDHFGLKGLKDLPRGKDL